jgi:hypothetical protein
MILGLVLDDGVGGFQGGGQKEDSFLTAFWRLANPPVHARLQHPPLTWFKNAVLKNRRHFPLPKGRRESTTTLSPSLLPGQFSPAPDHDPGKENQESIGSIHP